MKNYKFQALVSVRPDDDGNPCATLGSAPRRMVLRGHSDESGRSQVFTVLVSCDDNTPLRPGGSQVLATVRLAGDDVAEYLDIGRHFDLWLGRDIGEGVITRRLFV